MQRVCLLAILALFGLLGVRSAGAVVHAGDVAPDFHKTDLDGNPQTLYEYRGKVVVLFLLGYN